MGNPDRFKGNASVSVSADNTVNDEALVLDDIIVFGNSINDIGYTNGYVGYNLNRDGKVNTKDVAYVLSSFGN